jgi:hypothetical protein
MDDESFLTCKNCGETIKWKEERKVFIHYPYKTWRCLSNSIAEPIRDDR